MYWQGYVVLICQVKEKRKKKCSLKMLLKRRAKARQEIKWISRRIVIIFDLSVHLNRFVTLPLTSDANYLHPLKVINVYYLTVKVN